MVSRKTHARATGPCHLITRQPNEGRRQNGGLRFGPMEAETVSNGYFFYVCDIYITYLYHIYLRLLHMELPKICAKEL